MLRHRIRRLAGLAAGAGLLGGGCDQEGPNIDVESAIPVRDLSSRRARVSASPVETITLPASSDSTVTAARYSRSHVADSFVSVVSSVSSAAERVSAFKSTLSRSLISDRRIALRWDVVMQAS